MLIVRLTLLQYRLLSLWLTEIYFILAVESNIIHEDAATLVSLTPSSHRREDSRNPQCLCEFTNVLSALKYSIEKFQRS